MQKRYFERRWDESRGDRLDAWGGATYFFEVGEDGWPSRQIEVYDNGRILRYDSDHPDDEFGGLGQARLDELEDWSGWSISPEEFERVWSAK